MKDKPYDFIKDKIKELIALQGLDDIEIAHGMADDILCDILVHLGYKNVVKEYNDIKKWYS